MLSPSDRSGSLPKDPRRVTADLCPAGKAHRHLPWTHIPISRGNHIVGIPIHVVHVLRRGSLAVSETCCVSLERPSEEQNLFLSSVPDGQQVRMNPSPLQRSGSRSSNFFKGSLSHTPQLRYFALSLCLLRMPITLFAGRGVVPETPLHLEFLQSYAPGPSLTAIGCGLNA